MITHQTYDPTDCTSIGWDIHICRTMTRACYRNRWRWARNGVRITIHGDLRPVPAALIANALDSLRDAPGVWPPRRGDRLRILGKQARVTHAGHGVE